MVAKTATGRSSGWGGGEPGWPVLWALLVPPPQSWLAAGPRTRGKTTEPSGSLEFSLLSEGEKDMGVRTPGLGEACRLPPQAHAGGRAGSPGVSCGPFLDREQQCWLARGGMRGGRALGRGAAGKGLGAHLTCKVQLPPKLGCLLKSRINTQTQLRAHMRRGLCIPEGLQVRNQRRLHRAVSCSTPGLGRPVASGFCPPGTQTTLN